VQLCRHVNEGRREEEGISEAEMIAANQRAPIMRVAKLANLDNNKGYVVGEGAGAPSLDAIQNRQL
jgi:hypothetical protein